MAAANQYVKYGQNIVTGFNKLQLGMNPDDDHPSHFLKIENGNLEAGIWAKANGARCFVTDKCALYPQIKVPKSTDAGSKEVVIVNEYQKLMEVFANKGKSTNVNDAGIWISGKKYMCKYKS